MKEAEEKIPLVVYPSGHRAGSGADGGGLVLWMHSMLPWPNMVAMTSNFQMELSDPMRAYVVGGERDYSTLPEVLALQDGTGVETPEDMALRRAEVLDLFEKHVYGVLPKNGFETSLRLWRKAKHWTARPCAVR